MQARLAGAALPRHSDASLSRVLGRGVLSPSRVYQVLRWRVVRSGACGMTSDDELIARVREHMTEIGAAVEDDCIQALDTLARRLEEREEFVGEMANGRDWVLDPYGGEWFR